MTSSTYLPEFVELFYCLLRYSDNDQLSKTGHFYLELLSLFGLPDNDTAPLFNSNLRY